MLTMDDLRKDSDHLMHAVEIVANQTRLGYTVVEIKDELEDKGIKLQDKDVVELRRMNYD